MKHTQSSQMLVSFFNMTNGTRYRYGNWEDRFDEIISDDESNIQEIRKAIKKHAEKKQPDLNDFFMFWKYEWNVKPTELPEQKPVIEQKPMNQLDSSLNFLSGVVANMVASMKTEQIEQKVADGLTAKVDSYIRDTYGKVEKHVTLVSEFGKHEVKGVQHSKFEMVLKFVANDEPVYLTGPAGSGKNVICKQVAEALGLDFYFTNAVTQEYKLTGFTDANGTFHESQFYKAFTKGGLFMLDEMDASIPEVLIILNAAIANRYFDFPAPIGKVSAHPKFRVVAAGNTLGHGADNEYVGRNTLDAASLDRFAMIRIDYDKRIEMSVGNNNVELVRFCRMFRKASEKAGLQIVVSYRAIGRMAKMVALLSIEDVLESCLLKGLERDDLKAISNDVKGCGEYSSAFERIMSRV